MAAKEIAVKKRIVTLRAEERERLEASTHSEKHLALKELTKADAAGWTFRLLEDKVLGLGISIGQ